MSCSQNTQSYVNYSWKQQDNQKTIQHLAKKYGVAEYEIRSHNGLFDLNDAYPGLTIQIPVQKIQPRRYNRNQRKGNKLRLFKPAKGKVTSHFGRRWGKKHEGIDFNSQHGRDIFAAESGIVIFAGVKRGYGKTIIIRHNQHYKTLYAHHHKIYVKKNQRVKRGEKIAMMGRSGQSTGVHLHFEVLKNDKAINPIRFLQ